MRLLAKQPSILPPCTLSPSPTSSTLIRVCQHRAADLNLPGLYLAHKLLVDPQPGCAPYTLKYSLRSVGHSPQKTGTDRKTEVNNLIEFVFYPQDTTSRRSLTKTNRNRPERVLNPNFRAWPWESNFGIRSYDRNYGAVCGHYK